MGLFDKKFCDACGDKIGLLGNRRLEDGNLCGGCAKKLSPFFSDRRRSTVADIKAQLAYREENRKAVASFNATRSIGLGTRLILDEGNMNAIVAPPGRWRDGNPDVIGFAAITGCEVDVSENRAEERYRDSQGRDVGYDPPRYSYTYDFWMNIHVSSPYFDLIRFRINGAPVARGGVDYGECEAIGREMREALESARRKAAEESSAEAVLCPLCGATTIPKAGRCEYCDGPVK
ncbi:MAG: DUF4428 domain-containing protein [Candidatus Methanoplasma sp.]|nr:DUF4428 domain-containing protein [Candidatus Methanoplasma sp.]